MNHTDAHYDRLGLERIKKEWLGEDSTTEVHRVFWSVPFRD
jgi:hypothetical protein